MTTRLVHRPARTLPPLACGRPGRHQRAARPARGPGGPWSGLARAAGRVRRGDEHDDVPARLGLRRARRDHPRRVARGRGGPLRHPARPGRAQTARPARAVRHLSRRTARRPALRRARVPPRQPAPGPARHAPARRRGRPGPALGTPPSRHRLPPPAGGLRAPCRCGSSRCATRARSPAPPTRSCAPRPARWSAGSAGPRACRCGSASTARATSAWSAATAPTCSGSPGRCVAQLAALHAPDDVTLAIVADPAAEPDWAWARWLPHLLDRERIGRGRTRAAARPRHGDAAGDARRRPRPSGRSAAATAHRHGGGSAEARARSRLVVVDDAHGRVARPFTGPDSRDRARRDGRDRAAPGRRPPARAERGHPPRPARRRRTSRWRTWPRRRPSSSRAPWTTRPAPLIEALARRLAPLRLAPDSYDDGTGTPPADFVELLGIGDPAAIDPARAVAAPRPSATSCASPSASTKPGARPCWTSRSPRSSAWARTGCAWAPPARARASCCARSCSRLAATHPPSDLAIVLVDYKGGATFAPLAPLPHVAGLITNLSGDAALVERVYTSLDGEVLRRQQLLADAGRITDITEYRAPPRPAPAPGRPARAAAPVRRHRRVR